MTTNEYIADVLDDAARLIEKHGWRRERLIDHAPDGWGERMCLSGAVALASGHTVPQLRYYSTTLGTAANTTHRMAMRAIIDKLCPHGPDVGWATEHCIMLWNDQTCKDGEEARTVLEKAAAELRERVE